MSLGVSLSSEPWTGKIRVQSCQESCFMVTFSSDTCLPTKKAQTPKPLFTSSGPFSEFAFTPRRLTEDRESRRCVRTCSGSAAPKCSDFVQPARSCRVRGGSADLSSLPSVCILENTPFSCVQGSLRYTPGGCSFGFFD